MCMSVSPWVDAFFLLRSDLVGRWYGWFPAQTQYECRNTWLFEGGEGRSSEVGCGWWDISATCLEAVWCLFDITPDMVPLGQSLVCLDMFKLIMERPDLWGIVWFGTVNGKVTYSLTFSVFSLTLKTSGVSAMTSLLLLMLLSNQCAHLYRAKPTKNWLVSWCSPDLASRWPHFLWSKCAILTCGHEHMNTSGIAPSNPPGFVIMPSLNYLFHCEIWTKKVKSEEQRQTYKER